jgi:hypothetical protein
MTPTKAEPLAGAAWADPSRLLPGGDLKGVLLMKRPTGLSVSARCGATSSVSSAGPPLDEKQMPDLTVLLQKASRLFFILNKVAYLTPEEREEALQFLRRVLKKQGGVGNDWSNLPMIKTSRPRHCRERSNNTKEVQS